MYQENIRYGNWQVLLLIIEVNNIYKSIAQPIQYIVINEIFQTVLII